VCGGCGRVQGVDEWSGGLDSRRARWEVAHLVGDVLAGAGSPTRVSATPGGWVVRSATGRTTVADTLTALWRAVGTLPAGTAVPAGAPDGSVAAAVRCSYERSREGEGAPSG
jgi:hypothetical protein